MLSLARLTRSLVSHQRLALLLAALAVGGAFIGAQRNRAFADQNAVAGTITGTVFQDYNANGARDTAATINNNGQGTVRVAVDRGVAGVVVTAYDAAGAVAGTATSGADGGYTLNAAGGGPYRIEFTNLPAGFQPGPAGPNSGTHVQFVAGASASNVDFGIALPLEYCQNNPALITTCYIGGDQSGANDAIVQYPYSAGSTRDADAAAPFSDFDAPAHVIQARTNQVGSLFGLAYARSTRQLYSGALMKKHAGFGPGGPGAIYRTDTGTSATALYADLNTLLPGNPAGANAHNQADFDRDNGDIAWNAVGKTGLGGLAISEDDTKLFVLSLGNRTLYELPANTTPTSANIRAKTVPVNGVPNCANSSDVRPFAVHYFNGNLYVGLVCSGESSLSAANPNGDASLLRAYVYRVNPTTLDFDATPAFQAPLNYPRRCTDGAQFGPPNCFAAAWRAWSPTYKNIGTDGRGIYPQAWLTDIAFDRGNLILGLRDRGGDQFGNNTLDNPADQLRYYGVAAGDVLRACGDFSTGWTLESNGRCGGGGAAPQNSGEGPGNGEFYFRENSIFHDELGVGGMVQIPGFADVAVNIYSPIPIFTPDTLFDGGTLWLNDTTGARSKAYRVYNGQLAFDLLGKANGLGDLVALCDPAPLEIGNRIWRDLDGDGVQDAGEPGIAGVMVQLFKNNQLVGTATTDANGNYYFNGGNVAGGVLPNMAYEIRISKTQAAVSGLALTSTDADASTNGDARDSDATMNGTTAVIALTTGGPGANNHSFDAGFVQVAITCPPNQTACAVAGANSATVNYPAPTAVPAGTMVTCNPASGSSFAVGTTTVNCTATSNGATATCSFTVTVTAAPTIVCPANVTVNVAAGANSANVNYDAPTTTGGGVMVVCTPPSGASFPVGANTVNCTATNSCGTALCSFTITVGQPPTITCPPNQTACAPAGANAATVNYPAPTTGGGSSTVTCTPASGSSFAVGTTTVNCTATNGAGAANCSFTVSVTAAPTITCPSNVTANAAAGASSATVSYATPSNATCSPASGSSFAVGTTAVTCTATNNCGTANCSFTVTVIQAPTITCPPNQTACAPAGANATTVNYPAPTTTGTNPTVTCNPASGASFPVGTTTVNCTATNAAGAANCSFTVTVTATPALTCPANITATAATVGGTATVNYTTPTATPAGLPVTCTPVSGTAFAVGTTTVTCRATNSCGTTSCSFTVTVNSPVKCDTFCFRSPAFWLLNLHNLPNGQVQIAGGSNQFISTRDIRAITLALQGTATGFGTLTPRQRLNQEYVAAQLNLLRAGGGGSPSSYNVMWANISCYGITFPPVTLGNGFTLSTASMVKELYMQANLAVQERREQDFVALAIIFDLLNGNDPSGSCN